MLLGADLAHAGRRALVDVAEQAGTADLADAREDAVGARPHREDPQQLVDGVADRPGVGVGPEVAGALLLRAAPDHDARELLADGDRQPGVGLVVAVLHVEARVELLDPGVLQLERLDLGADDGPLDAGRGGHHGRGAGVEVGDVLEVRRQPGAEVLGLADVDDAAAGVGEAVDARRGRDRPRGGTVRRRVGHALNPTVRGGDQAGTTWRVGRARPATDSVGDAAAPEPFGPVTLAPSSTELAAVQPQRPVPARRASSSPVGADRGERQELALVGA